MPVQVPPSRRQVHAAVGLEKLLAKSGNGSLNRSKMTALLPLNAVATWLQNIGVNCVSGIGFWQVALTSVQPAPGPLYWPKVQCRSRIGLIPFATSRFTQSLTACRSEEHTSEIQSRVDISYA